MTQIPDAAVQAFMAEFHQRTGVSYEANIRASLEKTLPHLPIGYEVKKLEWVEDGRWGHLFSEGTYEIAIGNPYCALYILGKMAVRVEKERINDLKAAAQADFECRVGECLVPRPDIKTIIDEIRNGTRQGFLNEGDQPEASDAELSCPHCGGSGHIDDVATKAADVAAVRRQALEEAAKIAEKYDGMPCGAASGWPKDEIQHYMTGQQDASSSIAYGIRALSSEPAQGEQSGRAALAQGGRE